MKNKIILTIVFLALVLASAMVYFFIGHTNKTFSCYAKLNVDVTENNQSTKALYDIFLLFGGNNKGYIVVEGAYISNGTYKKVNTVFDFSYERQKAFYSIKRYGGKASEFKASEFLPFFLQWETTKFAIKQLSKDDFVISGPINPIFLVCTKT